jgi:hypothetical protein
MFLIEKPEQLVRLYCPSIERGEKEMPRLAIKNNISPRKKLKDVEVVSHKPDKENFEKILKQYSSAWKKLAKL